MHTIDRMDGVAQADLVQLARGAIRCRRRYLFGDEIGALTADEHRAHASGHLEPAQELGLSFRDANHRELVDAFAILPAVVDGVEHRPVRVRPTHHEPRQREPGPKRRMRAVADVEGVQVVADLRLLAQGDGLATADVELAVDDAEASPPAVIGQPHFGGDRMRRVAHIDEVDDGRRSGEGVGFPRAPQRQVVTNARGSTDLAPARSTAAPIVAG